MDISGGYLGTTPVLVCPVGADYDKLSRIHNGTIDTSKGICYFPAYPPFMKDTLYDLGVLFGKVNFSAKAQALIDKCKEMEDAYEKAILPPTTMFKTTPFDHQKQSFLYGYYHPRAALLLDCGLGKSKVAIDLINSLGKKTLILMPPSLISNWLDEIKTHSAKDLVVETLNDKSAADKKDKLSKKVDADVMLVGYETAARYHEAIFQQFDYDMIVCDESHRCKNIKSSRTKAALELAKKASRRYIMSGTAVLNDPTDLYPQLKLLSPQIVNQDYYAFCRKYLVYATWNNKIPVGVQNMDQLNKRVRKFSIRYMKQDCLDLPDRQIIDKYIDMTAEQWDLYREVLSPDDLYLDEGVVSKEYRMVALSKLSQITSGFMYIGQKDPKICDGCSNLATCMECGIKPYTKGCAVVQIPPDYKVRRLKESPKLDLVMELVDQILQTQDGKVIIWYKAIEESKMLQERLDEEKIKFCKIDGDPKKDLAPMETGLDYRVAIANVSQGTGFTANFCQYMIDFSMTFNLEHYLQHIDRNYRIGQKNNVTLFRLLARNTIDEKIVAAINNKVDIAEALLNNMECMRCKQMAYCAMAGIQQFDRGCILSKKKSTMSIK